MQVFKTALKLIMRSPVNLLLYIVLFGFLGVIIVATSTPSSSLSDEAEVSQESVQESARPTVAIIDRDKSAVSESITAFMAEHSTLVPVADNTKALQDATALNLASYILIIPEGFEAAFFEAARAGSETPALETLLNYDQSDGILIDLLTNKYLAALHIAAVGTPELLVEESIELATTAAAEHVAVEAVTVNEAPGASDGILLFFLWMAYPLTTGLIVLTAIVFASFQSGELKRRNLCSPLSPSALNAQVALGCLALVLLSWIFLVLLSFLPQVGGLNMLFANPLAFALLALAALVYALVPFALGFFISQIGLRETAINGFAIIVGLVFCFISGVFMGGVSTLGEGIQALAHFIPTYWYGEALFSLQEGVLSADTLASYFGNLGIVALFALAFFSVALLVGRQKAQSVDAGGNSAAEAVL